MKNNKSRNMKTKIVQFKELETRQAFFKPGSPDFENPFSKLSDETFVEKYAAFHVWHITEEAWPLNGVLIMTEPDWDKVGLF